MDPDAASKLAADQDARKARRELKKAAAAAAHQGATDGSGQGAAAAAAIWDRCMFWNAKKRKFCCSWRAPQPGIMFCGLHCREVEDPTDAASPPLQLGAGVAKTDTVLVRLPSGTSGGLSVGGAKEGQDAQAAPPSAAPTSGKVRVLCPVHPSHTVWAYRLAAHVRTCHATQRVATIQSHPAFTSSINFGDMAEADMTAIAALHASFEVTPDAQAVAPPVSDSGAASEPSAEGAAEAEEAGALAASSTRAAALLASRSLAIPPLAGEEPAVCPRSVEAWIATRLLPWYKAHVAVRPAPPLPAGPFVPPSNNARHKAQQDALVDALLACSPPAAAHASLSGAPVSSSASERVVLEFGAGRAGLAHAIATHAGASAAGSGAASTRYVLVDRAAGRGRFDHAIRETAAATEAAVVERVPLDIGDFNLVAYLGQAASSSGVGEAKSEGGDGEGPTKRPRLAPHPAVAVVGIGKHLCGAATDLSLRCLATTAAADAGAVVANVCIATCCHHVCNWRDYVGKDWWRGVLGGSAVDFEVARMVSAWGTNAVPVSEEHAGGDPVATALASPVNAAMPLCGLAKPVIGRMAKRLIDTGRAAYLGGQPSIVANGSKPQLAHYCDPRITPENAVLLLA